MIYLPFSMPEHAFVFTLHAYLKKKDVRCDYLLLDYMSARFYELIKENPEDWKRIITEELE